MGDTDFADVEIICSGKTFSAHRIVLAVASPVFATMLKTRMAEAHSGKICIEDAEPETVEAALQFMYEGTLPANVGHEAILFAHKYDIAKMASKVCDRVLTSLTPENAPSILGALNPLKRSCPDDADSEISRVRRVVRRA